MKYIYYICKKIQIMAKRSTILLALLASVCTVSAQNLEMLSGDPQWMYARYRNNEFESAEPNAQIDDVRNGFLETGGRKYHKLFQVDRLDIDDGNTLYALVEPIGVRECISEGFHTYYKIELPLLIYLLKSKLPVFANMS